MSRIFLFIIIFNQSTVLKSNEYIVSLLQIDFFDIFANLFECEVTRSVILEEKRKQVQRKQKRVLVYSIKT